MSDADPEQARRQKDLRDHSDRLLETVRKVGRLEAADRTQAIGSSQFDATARDVRIAADKLRQIAEAQEVIGDETETTDVSINDMAAGDRSAPANSGNPARQQPQEENR